MITIDYDIFEQLIEALHNIECDLETEISEMISDFELQNCETMMDYNYRLDCKKTALSDLKNAIISISGLEIGKEYYFFENGKKKKCTVENIHTSLHTIEALLKVKNTKNYTYMYKSIYSFHELKPIK